MEKNYSKRYPPARVSDYNRHLTGHEQNGLWTQCLSETPGYQDTFGRQGNFQFWTTDNGQNNTVTTRAVGIAIFNTPYLRRYPSIVKKLTISMSAFNDVADAAMVSVWGRRPRGYQRAVIPHILQMMAAGKIVPDTVLLVTNSPLQWVNCTMDLSIWLVLNDVEDKLSSIPNNLSYCGKQYRDGIAWFT